MTEFLGRIIHLTQVDPEKFALLPDCHQSGLRTYFHPWLKPEGIPAHLFNFPIPTQSPHFAELLFPRVANVTQFPPAVKLLFLRHLHYRT